MRIFHYFLDQMINWEENSHIILYCSRSQYHDYFGREWWTEWLTWRAFWVASCPEVVERTLYRLQPLVAAYAGSPLRCWRDKHSPRCWKTHRASQLSRCWQRGTGGGPGNQRMRCWGNHGQWLLQCCDSCRGAGRKEGWNPGTGLRTWNFPGAVSPTLQCHTARIQALLLWCSSVGTGAPRLWGKYTKSVSTTWFWHKFIYIIPLISSGKYNLETSSTFLMYQDVRANRRVLTHWNDKYAFIKR